MTPTTPNTKQELREKLSRVRSLSNFPDKSVFKSATVEAWSAEIEELLTDTVKAEVNKSLDELIKSSTEEIPMSSGDNIPFVRVSAIEQVRKDFK